MTDFSLAGMNESSKNVKKFKVALERACGQAVTFVTIDKMKKTAGEVSKDLNFGLENGQKVTFVIRKDGDAFRVRLNDKDLPLSADVDPDFAKSLNLAMKQIGAAVRGNQDKFNDRMASEKVRIPGSTNKKVATSSQIKVVQSEIVEIIQRIQQKTATRDDLKQRLQQQLEPVTGNA